MKLHVLMENTTKNSGFAAEHGLSLFIDSPRQAILFDMGQTGAFADNAAKMGIDLSRADIAFLSHGHYDHGGGFKTFLKLNNHAPVYVNENAFGDFYHGSERYIGLDKELRENVRLKFAGDNLKINEELELCSCNEKKRMFSSNSAGLTEKIGDCYSQDKFLHEQYLTIMENGRRILISGCSHKGILNIMEWLKPDIFIGGFHLMKSDVSSGRNDDLDKIAERLCGYNTEYYTCHCTGTDQYEYLRKIMGKRLHYISAGQKIEI